jgi:uncharacterized protein YegP (UPF0339 family)
VKFSLTSTNIQWQWQSTNINFTLNSTNNQWYWQFAKNDGTVVCTSPSYPTKQNALDAIALVKQWAASSPIF